MTSESPGQESLADDPLGLLLEDLLMPPAAMAAQGFPARMAPGLVATSPRAAGRRLVALDCEMCTTTEGPSVVRLSVVDEQGAELLDVLVQPEGQVVDWQTRFSGLGPDDLRPVTTTLADARRALLDLVDEGCVIVGHGLVNDALALGLVHRRYLDTLSLYGSPRRPSSLGSSLQALARRHLGLAVQQGHHDSREDARVALALARHQARRVLPSRDLGAPRPPPGAPLDLDTLLARLRLAPARVLDVYQFGSRVYGTSNERSDWDFIIVTDLDDDVEEHLSDGDVNAAVYSLKSFSELLDLNSVWALECLSLPPSCVWKQTLDLAPLARIDPALLRESVCAEAGFAWNKARRLFEREHDPYRGKKNAFHALRFFHYGIQLARTGRVTDHGAANHHLRAMQAMNGGWREIRAAFEGELRSLHRQFSALVPFEGKHRQLDAPRVEEPATSLAHLTPGPPEGAAGSLAAVRYLLEHGVQRLVDDHRLVARTHRAFSSLVQLSYSAESPQSSPVVRECRGLLLDLADPLRVVALPFERFFNHLEPQAAPIDWSTARVFEKLDGSLATLYWHAGRWHVASRTSPDGSGQMGWYSDQGATPFADLFWQIWDHLGYRLPDPEPRRCYLFELTTNRHQIVVRHEVDAITLHGVRDLETLRELDPVATALTLGYQHPRVVEGPSSFDDVQRLASALNPLRAEGFVVCDAAFHRVKIKSPAYVRLSVAIHGTGRQARMSLRKGLDLVRHGTSAEFIAYFPDQAAFFLDIQRRHAALVLLVEETYRRLQHLPRAEFGAAADQQRAFDRSMPRVLFALHAGKSAAEALRGLRLEVLERMVGKVLTGGAGGPGGRGAGGRTPEVP